MSVPAPSISGETAASRRDVTGRILVAVLTVMVLGWVWAPTALAQAGSGAGLSVTVGTSTNDPPVGDTFYYGVRVTNGGGSPVSGAVLEVVFPPSFRSEGVVAPAGCMAIPLGFACPLGTLAAGETRELYFPGRFEGLDDGDTIATVRDASGAITVEVERQDNDGKDDDRRRTGRRSGPAGADLSIDQTDSPDPSPVSDPNPGNCGSEGNIQYRAVVTNDGPDTVTDAEFTFEVTNGTICGVSYNNDFPCTLQTTTATCGPGTLKPGATALAVITVRTTSPGTTSSTVTVTSSTPDPNPSNDSETDTTTVVASD